MKNEWWFSLSTLAFILKENSKFSWFYMYVVLFIYVFDVKINRLSQLRTTGYLVATCLCIIDQFPRTIPGQVPGTSTWY